MEIILVDPCFDHDQRSGGGGDACARRRRLRLAFSKWAGSPAKGNGGSSSRSVSDGVVWVYNPRRRQRGSDLRGFAASLKGRLWSLRRRQRWWP
nr:hypothetical protein Iba_chr06bCG9050 [Ipomoea batatas]